MLVTEVARLRHDSDAACKHDCTLDGRAIKYRLQFYTLVAKVARLRHVSDAGYVQ
jgi:hypothetical protein